MSYKEKIKSDSVYDFYWQYYNQHVDEDYTFLGNFPIDLNLEGYRFSQQTFDANTSTHNASDIPGSRINSFVLEPNDDNSQLVRKTLNLEYSHVIVNKQVPGTVARVHFDINKGFFNNSLPEQMANGVNPTQVKKFVWFLEDQHPGQMFMLGNSYLSWHAFDCFEWPWYMLHATANASEVKRTAMIITGI